MPNKLHTVKTMQINRLFEAHKIVYTAQERESGKIYSTDIDFSVLVDVRPSMLENFLKNKLINELYAYKNFCY